MFDRFRRELRVSHNGHLLDPETNYVIWHQGGSPQPSCPFVDPDLKQMNVTCSATARPRPRGENRDPEHVPQSIRDWLPRSLRIPRELEANHRADLEPQQCWICHGYGHTRSNCTVLVAIYLDTCEGQQCCRTARYRFDPEVISTQAVVFARAMLARVLEFRYPLAEAAILCRDLMEEEVTDDFVEQKGDYLDRQLLLQALQWPRSH